MLNSDRFLKAFTAIEGHLRKLTNKSNEVAFYELLRIAGESNPVVKRYKDDLKEYADLRNAIVHERSDGHIIAEPNELAVQDIERISTKIRNPSKLYPLFQTVVISKSINEPISKAVELMHEHSYSQIPAYDAEKFMGLLTTNTITRWLGSCIAEDIFSLKETSIMNVLGFSEDEDNCCFMKREALLIEAVEKFHSYELNGKRLEAILITTNGRPNEKLLGIITIWDLPKIYKEL